MTNPTTGNTDHFGTFDSFPKALDNLYAEAQNGKRLAIMEQRYEDRDVYTLLLYDIRDILLDVAFAGDSDMWEDETFYGPNDTEWYVVSN